jgi:hypothetical protein
VRLLDFIAFSRNRPIQLHALLSSMKEMVSGNHRVTVLHRYDDEYQQSLNEVIELFPDVKFLHEESFRDQVLSLVDESGEHCAFLVDDIIFKESVDCDTPVQILRDHPRIFCFSLRLGVHLDHCFPLGSAMRVPDGAVSSGYFVWNWRNSEHDWNYPLSLDGHIFRTDQMKQMAEAVNYRNPNEFEAALQMLSKHPGLPPECISSVRSTILNVPMNRVQDEFKNRCLDVSVEDLHDEWKRGNEIDRSRLVGYINHGAHEPLTLTFRSRND